MCASVVNLQPIPEVYNLFDQVLLLQDSYLAYSGPRESEYCVSLPSSSLVWRKLANVASHSRALCSGLEVS